MDVTKEGLSSYSVWRHVLSSTKEVAIKEEEYNKIARADDIRREIANIEEKFFVICENYRELEEFVFSTNVKNMLYSRESASSWFSIGTEFGRLTLSMLASSRLYIDTVETHAKKILQVICQRQI